MASNILTKFQQAKENFNAYAHRNSDKLEKRLLLALFIGSIVSVSLARFVSDDGSNEPQTAQTIQQTPATTPPQP